MSVNSLLNTAAGGKDYSGYNEGLTNWLNELKAKGIITGFISRYTRPDRPNIFTIGLSEDRKDIKMDGVGIFEKQQELANMYGLDWESDILDVDIDVDYIDVCSADFFRRRYLANAN